MIFFLWGLIFFTIGNLKNESELNLIILLGIFIAIWILPNYIQEIVVRFGIYASAIYSCYVLNYETIGYSTWLVDAFLAVLVIVAIVAISITKKAYFRTTTQDLLVILFILSAILLIDAQFIGQALFRLFFRGYASEYLFNNKSRRFSLLRLSAIISMLLVIHSSLLKMFFL